MAYLFTSESVSEGHPDKVSDQISDAVLDAILSQDPTSKCACETFCTTGLVVVGGEIKTNAIISPEKIARDVIKRIGYTKSSYKFEADSCGVLNALHEQSSDIRQGVERKSEEEQGAGDQGMMFGYATNETENYMPLPIDLSHRILIKMAEIRKAGKEMTYLAPDSKSQVTVEYGEDEKPQRIDTIVVSTQHDDFASEDEMAKKIKDDVINILIPKVKESYPADIQKLFSGDIKYFVNPTGKFVIGGPHGDTGLTGRKIIVDTYGGRGAHGGGAFSGKDSSKVDRSAAYAARHIAKNIVAAGVADEIQVQLAYAIGVAEPVSIHVDTFGTSKVGDDIEISAKIRDIFDLRPFAYIKRLGLRNPIFEETAAYGHMGRKPDKKEVVINGKKQTVETFAWEKLDHVDKIKTAFGI
jgi:S-adenosylmethionine synthetase